MGIGFKTADTIAQAVGIPHDSPQRIRAGLQYTLSQAADNGHCYLPQPNLITDATKILEVDRELIGPCLDELVTAGGAVRELVPGEGGDLLRRSTWWPSTGPSSPWRPGCWPC